MIVFYRSICFVAVAAFLFAALAHAATPIDSITTNPPGVAFDNTVDVTSVTVDGNTFSNLLGPTSAGLTGAPPASFDFFWGSNAVAVEPLTPLGAVGGSDLSNGILNPGNTGQGLLNVIFPETVYEFNGGGADLFLFNPDAGAANETWSLQAIIGGTVEDPILAGHVVNFTDADFADLDIAISHQRNSAGDFTQDVFGTALSISDFGVGQLIGLQVNTPNGDPSAILAQAVPEPASIALWTLIGLVGLGYGYRRWKQSA